MWVRSGRRIAAAIVLVLMASVVVPAGFVPAAEAQVGGTGSSYVPVDPFRMIDSRPGATNVGSFATPWGAGESRSMNAASALGQPAINLTAVAVHVTTVDPTAPFSWLTAHATADPRPDTASVNFGIGGLASPIVNDLIIAEVDSSGSFSIYNEHGSVHLVIDVVGYYRAAGTAPVDDESIYVGLTPQRIIDSRAGATNVGPFSSPWGAAAARTVEIGPLDQVPAGTTISAVAMHVTTVSPSAPFSWLTMYPTTTLRSTTAALTFGTGALASQITNDLVIVKVNAVTNSVDIYNESGTVDLVIDVVGVFVAENSPLVDPGSDYVAVSPQRVIDTRPAPLNIGPYAQPWGPGESRTLSAASDLQLSGGNPSAVALQVTTVAPTAPFSWLTMHPAGAPLPTAAALNFGSGSLAPAIANDLVIAAVDDANKSVTIRNEHGSAHLVIDVVGYFEKRDATWEQWSDTQSGTDANASTCGHPNNNELERVVTGDFNGDQRTDLMCMVDTPSGYWTEAVQLATDTGYAPWERWGSAAGQWAEGNCQLTPPADFNGDGYDDQLCHWVDPDDGSTTLYTHDSGQTTFSGFGQGIAFATVSIFEQPRCLSYQTLDIDADGDHDVLCMYRYSNGSSATLAASYPHGNESRRWRVVSPVTNPLEFGPGFCVIEHGDVDGNGVEDLICDYQYPSGEDRAVWVQFADQGALSEWTLWSAIQPMTCNHTWVGDVDADGRADRVCLTDYGSSSRRILVQTDSASSPGYGAWQDWTPAGPAFSAAECVALGVSMPDIVDFNGDGRSDVVCAHRSSGGALTVYVATSTGSGFNDWQEINSVGASIFNVDYCQQVVLGDANGDAITDLICSYVYPNSSFATFVLQPKLD